MRADLHFHRTEAPSFAITTLAQVRGQHHPAGLPADIRAANPYYTLVLVEDAAPFGRVAGLPEQVPSSLYFSGPGQACPAAVQEWAQGQVVRFTDEFARLAGHERELLLFQLFHRPQHERPVVVPPEQATELAFLVSSMKRQAAGSAMLRDEVLRAYLKTLLLCCTRLSQQQMGETSLGIQTGLLGRFQQLLEVNYIKWKSVAEYAEHLQVTPNHLSVAIRKETGQPASNHIRRRIMLEAQRLIAEHDASLKEVAYELGFEDVSHFSKLFKRCTGTTFSAFKQQAQAQYTLAAPGLMVA